MKVLLLFPPQWMPFRPYLSLPSLSAYLKQHGIDVVQKDFNIDCYDFILTKNFLHNQQAKLRNRFALLDSKKELVPGIEQKYYIDLFVANSKIDLVACQVETAKEALRNGTNFYNVEAVSHSRKIIENALNIASLAYYPTRIELESFEMPAFHGSLEELEYLTQDKAQNPFIEICEAKLLAFIQEGRFDVVGITIAGTSQLIPALTISKLIKSLNINTHVVLGGHMITQLADTIASHKDLFKTFLDSAIVYEGEKPLLELVEHLKRGESLDTVPNLIYFDGQKVHSNDVLPPENINELPTPYFDDLPLNSYLSPELVLPLLSSRGCYWGKCAFCSQNLIYEGCYHPREVQQVVSDMKYLSGRFNVKHFAFVDEAISPKMMSRLSDEIIAEGLQISCSTNIRLEKQFDPALCLKIKNAGFKLIYPGLESGCNRVLELMEKGIKCETASQICANLHEAGIWNHLYVMLGFPGETLEEAHQTIDFLQEHQNDIRSFHIQHFGLGKGMKVWQRPGSYGIQMKESANGMFNIYYDFSVSSGLTNVQASEMTDNYMKTIAQQFSGYEILNKLGHHYLLLYLHHFQNSDPRLKSVSRSKLSNSQAPIKRFNKLSIPRLKSYIKVDRLHFNPLAIQNNISEKSDKTCYNFECNIVFNPDSGKLNKVPGQTVELLSLCTGIDNIHEIAIKLSAKYDAPPSVIERDCFSILDQMQQDGYLN